MDPLTLGLGILAPAILVGAFLLIAWGLASRAARQDVQASASAAAFAVPLGMLLGLLFLFGYEKIPSESWRWLPHVCLLLALLCAFEARAQASQGTRWAFRLAIVAAAVGLILRKRIWPAGGDLELGKLGLYLGTPLVVIAVWRTMLPRLGARGAACALWALAVAMSAMLLFAGSLKFALAGSALAGALGALVVACWLRPSVSGMSGAIVPVAVLLSVLAFLGLEFTYANYSPWLFAVIGLAPLLAWERLARNRTWLRTALIALPIVVALVLAFRGYQAGDY